MKTDQNKNRSEIQICLDGLSNYLARYEKLCPAIRQYSFSYEGGVWIVSPKTNEPIPCVGYYQQNLQKLLAYIGEHYSSKIDVPLAAKIVGYSHSEFGVFFKKQTGQRLVPYTNSVRIMNACRLLKETEYTCEQIAFDCGFNSYGYFKQVFKQIKGMRPSQYRIT